MTILTLIISLIIFALGCGTVWVGLVSFNDGWGKWNNTAEAVLCYAFGTALILIALRVAGLL